MGENRDYITYADEKGSVNISEEVISILAGTAAMETEGVAGLSSPTGKEVVDKLGRKAISKGIRVKSIDGEVKVDVFIMIKFGTTIGEVSQNIQENVKNSVESVTGLTVSRVNVHICGVVFGK